MSSRLIEVFEDKKLVEKIKDKLPYLFQLAELESSRAGKTGMEVGSLRERIIVALLIYKFGSVSRDQNSYNRSGNRCKVIWKTNFNKNYNGEEFSRCKIDMDG